MKTNQQKTSTRLRNRADFSRFYDCYAPCLYGYFLRQTNNPDVAAMRLKELFVTAWNRRDEFNRGQREPNKAKPGDGRPVIWLLTMARDINGV